MVGRDTVYADESFKRPFAALTQDAKAQRKQLRKKSLHIYKPLRSWRLCARLSNLWNCQKDTDSDVELSGNIQILITL